MEVKITNADGARRRLKDIREHNQRKSREVLQLWELLQTNIDSVGNEIYVILEQVALAALDCQDISLAKKCWDKISAKYPDSVRAQHLFGLMNEAAKNFDKAEEIYQSLLKQNDGDLFAKKRRVAILKAKGDMTGAVETLVNYLAEFPADYEAWTELCCIYTTCLDFPKAIQCAEELLLAQPHNYLYHQRLGELHYSAGGPDHLESARLYYLHALRLKPDDLRSLYGLYLVLAQICPQIAQRRSNLPGTPSNDLLPDNILCRIQQLHAFAETDPVRSAIIREAGAILLQTGPSANVPLLSSPQQLTQ